MSFYKNGRVQKSVFKLENLNLELPFCGLRRFPVRRALKETVILKRNHQVKQNLSRAFFCFSKRLLNESRQKSFNFKALKGVFENTIKKTKHKRAKRTRTCTCTVIKFEKNICLKSTSLLSFCVAPFFTSTSNYSNNTNVYIWSYAERCSAILFRLSMWAGSLTRKRKLSFCPLIWLSIAYVFYQTDGTLWKDKMTSFSKKHWVYRKLVL